MLSFLPYPGRRARHFGYTLTEILVVLGIIAVLIGLTTWFFSWGMQAADQFVEQAANAQIPHLKRQARADKGKLLAQIRNRHVVVFHGKVTNTQAEIAKIAQSIPLQVTHVYRRGVKGFAAVIAPEFVAALRNFPSVKYVQKDRLGWLAQEQVVTVNGQTPSTGLRRIDGLSDSAFRSHVSGDVGPRNIGPGVMQKDTTQIIVAVMDTGIDRTHPDLNVEFSRAFGSLAGTVTDQNGHGTHVSGIVGAINNNIGVVGVCPGCRLWNLRVADAGGSLAAADVIDALQFVAGNADKIRVVNMSFGFPAQTPDDPINDAVNACWNLGVVMVAAAGNSALDARGFSPASAAGAITVGALADSDGRGGGFGPNLPASLSLFPAGDPDDTMASFSNYGPRVDILAPGVNIVSTYPVALGSYYRDTGTSMSAPHVAGLAALMLSPTATGSGPVRNILTPAPASSGGPALTPDQVKQLILQNVGAPLTKYTAVPGLVQNKDTLVYPVLNAGPF